MKEISAVKNTLEIITRPEVALDADLLESLKTLINYQSAMINYQWSNDIKEYSQELKFLMSSSTVYRHLSDF